MNIHKRAMFLLFRRVCSFTGQFAFSSFLLLIGGMLVAAMIMVGKEHLSFILAAYGVSVIMLVWGLLDTLKKIPVGRYLLRELLCS